MTTPLSLQPPQTGDQLTSLSPPSTELKTCWPLLFVVNRLWIIISLLGLNIFSEDLESVQR